MFHPLIAVTQLQYPRITGQLQKNHRREENPFVAEQQARRIPTADEGANHWDTIELHPQDEEAQPLLGHATQTPNRHSRKRKLKALALLTAVPLAGLFTFAAASFAFKSGKAAPKASTDAR